MPVAPAIRKINSKGTPFSMRGMPAVGQIQEKAQDSGFGLKVPNTNSENGTTLSRARARRFRYFDERTFGGSGALCRAPIIQSLIHCRIALMKCATSSGCLDEIRLPSTPTGWSSLQMPPNRN